MFWRMHDIHSINIVIDLLALKYSKNK